MEVAELEYHLQKLDEFEESVQGVLQKVKRRSELFNLEKSFRVDSFNRIMSEGTQYLESLTKQVRTLESQYIPSFQRLVERIPRIGGLLRIGTNGFSGAKLRHSIIRRLKTSWNMVRTLVHISQELYLFAFDAHRYFLYSQDGWRDVLRIQRPLSGSWNFLNPLRNNITIKHWGVVISKVSRYTLEKVLKNPERWTKIEECRDWGDVHELKREGKRSRYYGPRKLLWKDLKSNKLTFVGQTRLTDEEIIKKGENLISQYPRYRLLDSNCQTFAVSFLEEACHCDRDAEVRIKQETLGNRLKGLVHRR